MSEEINYVEIISNLKTSKRILEKRMNNIKKDKDFKRALQFGIMALEHEIQNTIRYMYEKELSNEIELNNNDQ